MDYADSASYRLENIDREIRDGQIAIAFRQLPSALLTMIFISFLLSVIQWSVIDHTILIVWLVLQLGVAVWRYGLYRQFVRDFSADTAEKMKKMFMKGLVVSSIVFGSASIFLFPSHDIVHQALLSFVFAGMSAGATTTLSSLKHAVAVFLALTLFPLMVSLILEHTYTHTLMFVMVGLFWFMLFVISRRLYNYIHQSLSSKMLYQSTFKELQCTEERFTTIFKQAPVGIFYYDNACVILEVNNAMAHILNTSEKILVGLDMNHLSDKRLIPTITAVLRGEDGNYIGPYHSTLSSLDLHIVLHTSPVYDEARNIIGGVGIAMDITERVDSENTIRHLVYYDALTDIPNRFLLMERIQQALIRCKRNQNIAALMFINLDRFKTINDSLGHNIGDEILKDVVQRIQQNVREEDTVARVGGDEFVVLLLNSGTGYEQATSNTERIAEKIHQAIAVPFHVEGHTLNVTSSIGIAFVQNENESANDLLKHADAAMSHAKKEGKNTTRFYQSHMDEWIKKRLFLERELRHAVENGELELYYQPVIEIETRKIIGAEALLRWNHPKLGLVMPDDMISIAEESGLIVPIGEWVLLSACRQCVEWKSKAPRGEQITKIAVNVSALQFKQHNFVEIVKNVLEETQIDPHLLEIELTESMIIDSLEATIAKMDELRALGIRMSIDDFGTGYSSLSYLKRLPFSTLKIDRSFVRDILVDQDDAVMVETMISMASIFNMNVIAEGVETIEQFEFLERHRCRYFQGYLCSKPVQVNVFEELLMHDVQSCSSHS
ncbi:EAL domain-containing protein [Sulfuricurvum sp.]|nr:EAL domain-containing protein [Sulfuricurvum sp.]MDD4883546.1 EAL domain-containing protein [Sulfuricurvum sp.]